MKINEALSLGPLQALQLCSTTFGELGRAKFLEGEVIRKQGRESKLTITTSKQFQLTGTDSVLVQTLPL